MHFKLISIQASSNNNEFSHKAIHTVTERKKKEAEARLTGFVLRCIEEESVIKQERKRGVEKIVIST